MMGAPSASPLGRLERRRRPGGDRCRDVCVFPPPSLNISCVKPDGIQVRVQDRNQDGQVQGQGQNRNQDMKSEFETEVKMEIATAPSWSKATNPVLILSTGSDRGLIFSS